MSGKFRHSERNIRGITIRLGQDAEQRCAAISREPAEGLLQVNKRGPIPFRSAFYTDPYLTMRCGLSFYTPTGCLIVGGSLMLYPCDIICLQSTVYGICSACPTTGSTIIQVQLVYLY